MKLIDLEAKFLKFLNEKSFRIVSDFKEADGVEFLCPKCYKEIGSSYGCHSVLCWFEGHVPDDLDPKPGRWTPSGTGIHDLTFVPGAKIKAVSVLLNSGCGWHGFVKSGEAE